jgi:hypothetical protein
MGSVAVGLELEYLHTKVVITDVRPYIGDNMTLIGRDEIDMVYLNGPHQGEHVTTYRVT